MPRFQYVALDARGQESTGSVEANSANDAIGHLRQSGYFPTGVYEEGKAPAARDGKVKRPRSARIAAPVVATPKRKTGITLFQRQKVKAGELGGVLEVVLTRLAEFQEKAQKIKGKVLSAMIYPIIVMTMAVVIMGFLLVFIVPRFEAIFKDMLGDKPLPGITIFVITISNFAKDNWALLIGAVVALIIGIKLLGRTPGGRGLIDQL